MKRRSLSMAGRLTQGAVQEQIDQLTSGDGWLTRAALLDAIAKGQAKQQPCGGARLEPQRRALRLEQAGNSIADAFHLVPGMLRLIGRRTVFRLPAQVANDANKRLQPVLIVVGRRQPGDQT